MPNPFPGMNPYLEGPRYWPGVHLRFIAVIQSALNESLPRHFAASVEERVYVAEWGKEYIPDDIVVQRGPEPLSEPVHDKGGGTAVLSRPQTAAFDAPLLVEMNRRAVRERFLEIRTVGEEELIAVIEILSPANKTPGTGREEYLRKQRDVIESGAHLLEIDLLRAGEPTVAPTGAQLRRRAGAFDYIISLHRAYTGERYDVWPRTIRDRLPHIGLPLTEEAGDVPLDLQTIVDRSYTESGMERLLNYRDEAVPPLKGNDVVWADALLKAAGLR